MNDLTKSTEIQQFKPTPHMIVWIDTALRLMSDNIDEIARESGMDESTYYKWLKNDDFIRWFKDEWDRRLAGHAWKLDAIGLRQAKKDHKYWQDMQRRVGNLKDAPVTAVQVNSPTFTDDQLHRLLED